MQQDNPNKLLCAALGCANYDLSRGLCSKHYTWWLRHGKPETVEGSLVPDKKHNPDNLVGCLVSGCDRPYHHKGLCGLHSQRWIKLGKPALQGDLTRLLALRDRHSNCSMPGCKRTSLCKGLCRNHYRLGRGDIAKYGWARFQAWKRMLVTERGSKCQRCGFQTEVMTVYHFHHRDPSKKKRSVSECDTLGELRREAALCDLLCSNCHSIVHWTERRAANNKTVSFNDLGLHIPRNRL